MEIEAIVRSCHSFQTLSVSTPDRIYYTLIPELRQHITFIFPFARRFNGTFVCPQVQQHLVLPSGSTAPKFARRCNDTLVFPQVQRHKNKHLRERRFTKISSNPVCDLCTENEKRAGIPRSYAVSSPVHTVLESPSLSSSLQCMLPVQINHTLWPWANARKHV